MRGSFITLLPTVTCDEVRLQKDGLKMLTAFEFGLLIENEAAAPTTEACLVDSVQRIYWLNCAFSCSSVYSLKQSALSREPTPSSSCLFL